MKILKFFLISLCILCILTPGFSLAYIIFRLHDFSEKRCEIVRENYKKIQIGMNKEEVLFLIEKKPLFRVYRNSGTIFPEQKKQWEIWRLCKEKPYKWQMIAFDTETEKVVKIFSDDPERVGFE
jgi:hypothetical protein